MKKKNIKVIILGATGLIGNGLYINLSRMNELEIYGTIRQKDQSKFFIPKLRKNLLPGIDATDHNALLKLLSVTRPDVLVNCVGLTKHLPSGTDPLLAIPLNSYLPHYLAAHCKHLGIRLIHISSDCVFSGANGNYNESDVADATDIYGLSKALGEVNGAGAITLRTSTIGHELGSSYGLLDWFLSQHTECFGFKRALFSGIPTVELANIIANYVIPNIHLTGLYHVAGQTISKYELLSLIAKEYAKVIRIVPENEFIIDRSLNSEKFSNATGYRPKPWPKLIKMMHQSHQG